MIICWSPKGLLVSNNQSYIICLLRVVHRTSLKKRGKGQFPALNAPFYHPKNHPQTEKSTISVSTLYTIPKRCREKLLGSSRTSEHKFTNLLAEDRELPDALTHTSKSAQIKYPFLPTLQGGGRCAIMCNTNTTENNKVAPEMHKLPNFTPNGVRFVAAQTLVISIF